MKHAENWCIDLHSHTTHSDGVLTPAELVRRAARAGVTHLAVTDHDTISGLQEASEAAREAGIELIPGVEVSATLHGRECHVLGHGIRAADETLLAWCRSRSAERRRRIEQMLERLGQQGIAITLDEVIEESGGHTLARPHLARVLVKRGHARTLQDAFDRFLTRREVASVEWSRPEIRSAIELIHAAGGTACIAHPGVNRISSAELKALAEQGLDAVEAAHPEHPPSQAGAFKRWARDLGLSWTGGSDFHGGPYINAELGAFPTSADQWEALCGRRPRNLVLPR